MADPQSLLRQRALIFQQQQKKREAAKTKQHTDKPTNQSNHLVDNNNSSDASLFNSSKRSNPVVNGEQQKERPPITSNKKLKLSHPDQHNHADNNSNNLLNINNDTHSSINHNKDGAHDAEQKMMDDPLDSFMVGLHVGMSVEERQSLMGGPVEKKKKNGDDVADSDSLVSTERYYGDDEGAFDEDELDVIAREGDSDWLSRSKVKKKEIKTVDHSTIQYLPIRKNFWLESREVKNMSEEEIVEYCREKLEGVKIRGQNCPRPFFHWNQCGLPTAIYDTIIQSNYATPFPIQSQAIPIIMSGRDCIASAKTGSGKTLAFLLPMFRHVLDQPPVEPGGGPIALILAPTRELAVQIFSEARRFAKNVNLRVICVYGGSSVGDQISALKRGSDIIVATPGRLIDMLCANNGRVLTLQRVSFVVLDEADRMFDMGFEPQLMKIMEGIRPDRQVVMFSATFPASVERLARKALKQPIELIIGAGSTANTSVTQYVEVRKEEEKFPRLLELLGKWYQTGSIIIFVDTQESVDLLFRELLDSGYGCLALHGGMDQNDRDYTLADFKSGQRSILIATSVIARGLDVKDCNLVINYSVPNHYEDYVHRIGRTGRAGKNGTAITFVEPEQEQNAPDLIKALTASKQIIPQDLQQMFDAFQLKKKAGLIKYGGNDGFGGKGYKFDEAEEAERKEKERILRLSQNPDADPAELQQLQEELKQREEEKAKLAAEKEKAKEKSAYLQHNIAATATSASSSLTSSLPPVPLFSSVAADPVSRQLAAAKAAALAAALSKIGNASDSEAALAVKAAREKAEKKLAEEAAEKAKAVAVAIAAKQAALFPNAPIYNQQQNNEEVNKRIKHTTSIEINDYPQQARWMVTRKGALNDLLDATDCAVTTKGSFIEKRKPLPGEEKLYLLIEGDSEVDVTRCRNEILRRLEQASIEAAAKEANQFNSSSSTTARGRYSVI